MKTNTAWYHLYMESEKRKKNVELIETENGMVVARGCGVQEIGRVTGERVQTFSSKMNKIRGSTV